MTEPEDGRGAIERSGFSYLPHFISIAESEELIRYFAQLMPLWERRHADDEHGRSPGHDRRLTRPVYWLGGWQFACLGYYAEPDHREHRCLRGEEFPPVMAGILARLGNVIESRHPGDGDISPPQEPLPNTCLINYYGREVGQGVPRDYARLRMHRDGEPGPVIMFCIGQAGLLEFVDPERSPDPELRLWTRHRSVTILSGPDFKDRLYHRIVQVRMGDKPELRCRLPGFEARRVSVSFRHVPAELISDFGELPAEKRAQVRDYVRELSTHSPHYRQQLASEASGASTPS